MLVDRLILEVSNSRIHFQVLLKSRGNPLSLATVDAREYIKNFNAKSSGSESEFLQILQDKT